MAIIVALWGFFSRFYLELRRLTKLSFVSLQQNPYVVNAKALIDSGSLGQILAVQGQWTALKPLSYFQAPTEWRQDPKTGGVVLINLVHDIDLFRHFFGNIIRVYCEVGSKTRGFEVDETGAITLKFASAIVGT